MLLFEKNILNGLDIYIYIYIYIYVCVCVRACVCVCVRVCVCVCVYFLFSSRCLFLMRKEKINLFDIYFQI